MRARDDANPLVRAVLRVVAALAPSGGVGRDALVASQILTLRQWPTHAGRATARRCVLTQQRHAPHHTSTTHRPPARSSGYTPPHSPASAHQTPADSPLPVAHPPLAIAALPHVLIAYRQSSSDGEHVGWAGVELLPHTDVLAHELAREAFRAGASARGGDSPVGAEAVAGNARLVWDLRSRAIVERQSLRRA